MTRGVYKIVNLRDDKASTYIGSSVNIDKRWREHRRSLRAGRHANAHLQAAWNKYGEAAFAFGVLEEIEDGTLLPVEQNYLNQYFGRGHCYNIAITAGPAGPKSEEHRRRLSKANSGYKHTNEARRKISEAKRGKLNPNWGKQPTEETRRKLSAAAMGNQNALGNQYKHTDEAKRKMSEAAKRGWARKRAQAENK